MVQRYRTQSYRTSRTTQEPVLTGSTSRRGLCSCRSQLVPAHPAFGAKATRGWGLGAQPSRGPRSTGVNFLTTWNRPRQSSSSSFSLLLPRHHARPAPFLFPLLGGLPARQPPNPPILLHGCCQFCAQRSSVLLFSAALLWAGADDEPRLRLP